MGLTINDLQNEKLGLCVSGGLDSRTLACKLTDLDVEILCFTADLAQPDESDIEDVRTKMAPCGVETIIVDLKDAMADACFDVIRSQATYDGGYWNTTGIARAVTVHGLIKAMQERGCTVLSHGATGRGNDQVRFERYTNVLAPSMRVYAPWRDDNLLDEFPGRTEMAAFLAERGLEASVGPKKHYSTDANLAGLSHEAEDLESLETAMTIVEPTMGVWPHQAPDQIESVSVTFVAGSPVALNGEKMAPLALMEAANTIAGRNGVGMKNALENRIVGTKSRGVYEAPGMELLGSALDQLYMAVFDRRSADLFEHLSKLIGQQVYDGRYFDPATQAAFAAVNSLTARANGTVTVGLYKGNVYFQSLVDCAATIYNEADSSMEASDGLNPVSSQGFVEVQSVEAIAMANAGQIRAIVKQ